MKTEDLAMYILCMNVRFKDDKIPGTSLDISELMDHALIFPYVDMQSKEKFYFVPTLFWQDLPIKYPAKWEEVTVYMNQLIPGFDLTKLWHLLWRCIQLLEFL